MIVLANSHHIIHISLKITDIGHCSEHHENDWRFTFASAKADLFHYRCEKKALKLAFVILKFLIKYEQQEQGFCELCCNFVR